ncbi:alpha/beta hydrolase family protein [Algibacillus agarilyticus]|uniref:alpha/beta hydrolase family protein n=1 Tax=Algibacillus agarilyticus TaxID=2234133 RepID=UPI000DD08781|nr:DUF2920 family protein [Algibacillus agarilyticus]
MKIRLQITRFILLFLPLMTISHFSSAAKIPISAYGYLPEVSMMTISPTGKYIAFRKNNVDKDTYAVVSLKNAKTIAAIDIGDANPTQAYFVSDEKIILKAGKHQLLLSDFGHSKREVTTAFGFNIPENKIHPLLIPGEGIYRHQFGIGNVKGVSEDHEFAYIPAYIGGVAYGEWQGTELALMRARISHQRKPKIYARGTEHTFNYVMGQQGNVLAREDYDHNTNQYKIAVPVEDNWQPIYEVESIGRPTGVLGVTPDYKQLVIIKTSSKYGRQLYSINVKTGEVSDQPLFKKAKHEVENVITDINNVIYGVRYAGFTPSYAFFDDKITQRIQGIQDSLANTSVYIKDWSTDWQKIVVYIEGQESSGEYMISTPDDQVEIVAHARPQIPYTAVHPMSQFKTKTRDGLKIPTLITYPNTWNGKTKLPTIMLPHGGPHSHDRIGFNWMAQYFAESGYLVVQPQFRGSTGFGYELRRAGQGEWGKAMQTDLDDALAKLIKQGMADPDRTCIVGGSYGGYAALTASTITPNKYRCVVSYNGVSDLAEMANSERKKHGETHSSTDYWNNVAGIKLDTENDKSKSLDKKSPINNTEKFNAPILLIHGEKDERVPLSQSEAMYSALKKQGKNVKLIALEQEDHYLRQNETRMKTLEAIAAFIKQHI